VNFKPGKDAMVKPPGWIKPLRRAGLLLLLLLASPQGCSQNVETPGNNSNTQIVRVRLYEEVGSVSIAGGDTLQFSLSTSPGPRALSVTPNADLPLSLSQNGWSLGGANLGVGILTLQNGYQGSLRVNRTAYRGQLRFVPLGGGRFDVINDLAIDDYLKGVVPSEMYHNWHPEAFKAQAVVARTYALYEVHTEGLSRSWDVYDDQRSQVYGGISAETSQTSQAVEMTSGIVLTYGPGDGKIFKAYFSSCCGGVSQAAADAFPGDPYIMPLSEQYRGACCNASKYFNWGPITLSKAELTRRFHLWAQHQSQLEGRAIPELNMAEIYRLDVQAVNRYGRPNRVLLTDTRGTQYSMAAEEMRDAANTDANSNSTLPSSFCKINGDPNSDSVTFYDGHGYGHGVGMCQWCAQAEALAGEPFQQILLSAYPSAKLVRAY
jgi:stage II sporulation protein D